MTTAMKAAFTLTLEDKLTSGLSSILKDLGKLRDTGNQLTLGKLERSGDLLTTLSREVRNLTSDLRGIEAAADRGWAAMKRMASTKFQNVKTWGKNTFGEGAAGHVGVIGGAVSGISLIDPVRRFAKYQDNLIHVGITKELTGQELRNETSRLRIKFNAEATETGQTSESILDAYSKMIKKGINPKLVEDSIRAHALASTAYQTDSDSFTGATSAMLQSFKITPDQMPQALSALGQATKKGDFKANDFSMYLPGVGAQFARNGISGLKGVYTALAALQTTSMDVHEPGQAATDLSEGMRYIFSGAGAHAFSMENMHKGSYTNDVRALIKRVLGNGFTGINIYRTLKDGEKKGLNPFEVLLPKLANMTKGLDFADRSLLFTGLFKNDSAGKFWGALSGHPEFFSGLLSKLTATQPEQLQRDADTAMTSPQITLNKSAETIEQIERRVGQGFEPIVKKLVSGLEGVVTGINKADEAFPKLTDAVLQITGSILAGVALLAAGGLVASPLKAGASLVLPVAKAATPLIGPLLLGEGIKLTADAVRDFTKLENSLPEQTYLGERQLMNVMTPPNSDASGLLRPFEIPPPPPPGILDITVRTEPGTTATIDRATEGLNVKTPNPGPTTNRW